MVLIKKKKSVLAASKYFQIHNRIANISSIKSTPSMSSCLAKSPKFPFCWKSQSHRSDWVCVSGTHCVEGAILKKGTEIACMPNTQLKNLKRALWLAQVWAVAPATSFLLLQSLGPCTGEAPRWSAWLPAFIWRRFSCGGHLGSKVGDDLSVCVYFCLSNKWQEKYILKICKRKNNVLFCLETIVSGWLQQLELSWGEC